MRVLKVLRQPLENKVITISPAQDSPTFPASFYLIAAINPFLGRYYNGQVASRYRFRLYAEFFYTAMRIAPPYLDPNY
jgi:predicted ATPase with chaperone activity